MKKIILALLLVAPIAAKSQPVTVNSFDDIQYWVGTGTNRAALVIDFGTKANPAAIAWGYRWNGTANAASMLFALAGSITGSDMPSPQAGADMRLSIDGSYFASLDDYFISSISYNQVGLPSGWSQSLRVIQDTWSIDRTYPSLYSILGNGEWAAAAVEAAAVGISAIDLTNGGWIGFAQTDGENPYTFNQPAAATAPPIPAPSTRIERGDNGAKISFISSGGYYYRLQAKDSIGAATWTDLGPALAGNGLIMEMLDPGASSREQRFYRVLISR